MGLQRQTDWLRTDQLSLGPGYSDVDAGAWYAESVAWCRENNLMAGVGGGRFAPDSTLTRAMLAAVLWRQAGSPAVNYTDAV